jgi:Fur family ferric uptake transcriptional regulator
MRRKPSDEAALRTRLRAAGLRATGPRVEVLGALDQASGPVSHGELAEQLSRRGLDRVTVYRNLQDLAEAGLVERTLVGDTTWRFELKGAGQHGAQRHPHFTCTSCGEVTCLPDGALKVGGQAGLPRALGRGEAEVSIRGVCDGCDR